MVKNRALIWDWSSYYTLFIPLWRHSAGHPATKGVRKRWRLWDTHRAHYCMVVWEIIITISVAILFHRTTMNYTTQRWLNHEQNHKPLKQVRLCKKKSARFSSFTRLSKNLTKISLRDCYWVFVTPTRQIIIPGFWWGVHPGSWLTLA